MMEFCCVCLRGAREVQLTLVSVVARALFAHAIAGIWDTDADLYVCEWCSACVRKAAAVCSNMAATSGVLASLHLANRDGLPFDETLITNARKYLIKPLTTLCVTKNKSIDIGVNCDSENRVDVETMGELEIDDNNYSDFVEESHIELLQVPGSILDVKENIKEISIEKPSYKINRKTKTELQTKNVTKSNKNECNDEEIQFEVIHLSYQEQIKEIEERKQSEKYKNSKYTCGHCALGFTTEDIYKNHMHRHDKSNGSHRCGICKLYFGKKEVQLQHVLAHRRHYRCLRCSAVVRRRCHCVAHRARCGVAGPPAVCECCKKMFRDKYSLKQHMRDIHLKEETFECQYCNKMFKHKQKLIVHMRSHTGEKPYECATCNRKFTTNSNLTAHTAVHELTRQHYCVECDVYLKTAKGLRRHYETTLLHQNNDSLSFQCSRCPQQFVNARRLEAHSNYIHLGRANYRCDVCAKGFGSSSNLNKHVRAVHRKERPNKDKMCDVCGKSFALNKTLQAHRNTHSGVRPYSCEYCNAKFTQQSTLYNHVRIFHSNINGP